MTTPRTLSEIADEVLANWVNIPRDVRATIGAMRELKGIESPSEYLIVRSVREEMSAWRTDPARRLKREIETILSHYRADL